MKKQKEIYEEFKATNGDTFRGLNREKREATERLEIARRKLSETEAAYRDAQNEEYNAWDRQNNVFTRMKELDRQYEAEQKATTLLTAK